MQTLEAERLLDFHLRIWGHSVVWWTFMGHALCFDVFVAGMGRVKLLKGQL